MPEPFRPETAALVLIDHQVGTMQLIKTLDVETVKRNTVALAKAAAILDLPVVLTSSQEDHIQQPLMAELAELLPDAYAFAIWGAIFAAAFAYAVWQALPAHRGSPLARATGWPLALAYAGNAAWIAAATGGAPLFLLVLVLGVIVAGAVTAHAAYRRVASVPTLGRVVVRRRAERAIGGMGLVRGVREPVRRIGGRRSG